MSTSQIFKCALHLYPVGRDCSKEYDNNNTIWPCSSVCARKTFSSRVISFLFSVSHQTLFFIIESSISSIAIDRVSWSQSRARCPGMENMTSNSTARMHRIARGQRAEPFAKNNKDRQAAAQIIHSDRHC
jgi:hypothetical protein